MKKNTTRRIFLLGLAACILVSVTSLIGQAAAQDLSGPGPGSSSSGAWIDKITEYVLLQEAVSKAGSYESYLSDLRAAKAAREKGDWVGQYQSMNRFIDKLEAREGGISDKSASDILEYTYLREPRGLHDASRDVKIHPEIKKWEARMARQREIAEKSF